MSITLVNLKKERTMIGYVVCLKYNGIEIVLNHYGSWSNQHASTQKNRTKVFATQELANSFIKMHQSKHDEILYTREYYRTTFIK